MICHDGNAKAFGEHRPLACRSRQLAETGRFTRELRLTGCKGVAGRAAGNCRLAACAPQKSGFNLREQRHFAQVSGNFTLEFP